MRRSVREATIGFSLLAALAGGFALWFWLTGVAFGQKVWTFRLSFADAAGLAPQSTVTFRGVAVGTVRQVKPQSGAVLVTVQINDANLLLPRPIIAQVRSGSLLGGDPEIALVTEASATPSGVPGPLAKNCDPKRIVCADGLVQGIPTPSLTTVMGLMESMASGVPVVSTRVGMAPDLILDQTTGGLARPEDAEDIAAKALGLLSLPEDAAARLRILAREAVQVCDWSVVGRRHFDEVYKPLFADAS